MTEVERMLAEHACARLCTAFHVYVDSYQHDRIPGLFAEDAVWHHMMRGAMTGREAFAEYLDSKSTYPVIRHLVTNVLIDVTDEDHASGVAYVTVLYSEPTSSPPVLEAPIVLVTYHDTYHRTPEGWRFASRRPEITQAAPSFGRLINTKDDERRLRRNFAAPPSA